MGSSGPRLLPRTARTAWVLTASPSPASPPAPPVRRLVRRAQFSSATATATPRPLVAPPVGGPAPPEISVQLAGGRSRPSARACFSAMSDRRAGSGALKTPAAVAAKNAAKRGGSAIAAAPAVDANDENERGRTARKRKTSLRAAKSEPAATTAPTITTTSCARDQVLKISYFFKPQRKPNGDLPLPAPAAKRFPPDGTAVELPVVCPVCWENIHSLDEMARTRHVDLCLEKGALDHTPGESTSPSPLSPIPAKTSESPGGDCTVSGTKSTCEATTEASPRLSPSLFRNDVDARTGPVKVLGDEAASFLEDVSAATSGFYARASEHDGRSCVAPNPKCSEMGPHQKMPSDGANGKFVGSGSTFAKSTSGTSSTSRKAASTSSSVSQSKPQPSDRTPGTPRSQGKKPCPSYKRISGTSIVVDAFSYGPIEPPQESTHPTAYFLTHFHSDHYGGLTSRFSDGILYCSAVTGELAIRRLGVNPELVRKLPMDEEVLVQNVGVTLIEANHCPGAVLFVFRIFNPDGTVRRVLHTGDFRALPSMTVHESINLPIDTLYLDTLVPQSCSISSFVAASRSLTKVSSTRTYCKPAHSFPSQWRVVSAAAKFCKAIEDGKQVEANIKGAAERAMIKSWLSGAKGGNPEGGDNSPKRNGGRNMFVVGTYSIGKEKLFKAIAQAIGSKIYVSTDKASVLRCYHDAELDALLTSDPLEASVHVIGLSQLNTQSLSHYLASFNSTFARIYAFRPTGWTFMSKGTPPSTAAQIISSGSSPAYTVQSIAPFSESDTINIYCLPYSEHSSFSELARFVMALDVKDIVATVNTRNDSSMARYFEDWQAERKKRGGSIPWTDD